MFVTTTTKNYNFKFIILYMLFFMLTSSELACYQCPFTRFLPIDCASDIR